MDSYFGMATVCPQGMSPNRKYKRGRGARQCIKDKKAKKTLSQLQTVAAANQVSIYKRRKDDKGFTRTPLSMKALKSRLTRMKVSYFGMATACPKGQSPDPTWSPGRGRAQCLMTNGRAYKQRLAEYARLVQQNPDMGPAIGVPAAAAAAPIMDYPVPRLVGAVLPGLSELQRMADANNVPIYKSDGRGGFTRTPLSERALKSALTKKGVNWRAPSAAAVMPFTGTLGFGMATVCPQGMSPNRKYKRGRGARQCIKDKKAKKTLKQLQTLARSNQVSIYKRRKDDMGFTRTPLSIKALKLRLTRMKVAY
mgnify:CR=1 FL=1